MSDVVERLANWIVDYASMGATLGDQVQEVTNALREEFPEVDRVSPPAAWARAVHSPSSPHGPAEYDVDMVWGDDQPAGDGWFPLYRDATR